MALKLISERAKKAGYLAGYFALLLYTLSGLMFKDGIWLLVGAFCWLGIVSRFFVSYIYRYNKRRLLEISLKTERQKREKNENAQKEDKSFFGFKFLSW